MDFQRSRSVDLPSTKTSGRPSPNSNPHYVIATQEITADQDAPLGAPRRTGSVFKGFWNNSLVAVKILSNDTPADVGYLSTYTRARISSNIDITMQTLLDRIACWQILRHPHVLQVFGVSSLDADPPYIISQYYPNGNANEFLAMNPDADRAKIVSKANHRLSV
jgi:hypothetical protein